MRLKMERSFSGSEFEETDEESESMFADVVIDGRCELVIDGFYRRVARIKIARPCVGMTRITYYIN
jgi:hypothetical protein